MGLSKEALERRRAYQREYYQKNRERILKNRREWNKQNPEKVRKYQRDYWERKAKEDEKHNSID